MRWPTGYATENLVSDSNTNELLKVTGYSHCEKSVQWFLRLVVVPRPGGGCEEAHRGVCALILFINVDTSNVSPRFRSVKALTLRRNVL